MKVLIPDHDDRSHSYAGGIEPGWYDVAQLLRDHADDPDAVRFIADMLEE